MVDRQKIENRIKDNREEINRLLNRDVPLDLLYTRIKMLAAQNERLLKKIREEAVNNTILLDRFTKSLR